jgi:rhamnogalacturonyl hydrolase YesR
MLSGLVPRVQCSSHITKRQQRPSYWWMVLPKDDQGEVGEPSGSKDFAYDLLILTNRIISMKEEDYYEERRLNAILGCKLA